MSTIAALEFRGFWLVGSICTATTDGTGVVGLPRFEQRL